MDLPEITEVKRLTLQPGDSLVVRLSSILVRDDVAHEVITRVREMLDAPHLPVIVLGCEDDIEVIGQAPALTAAERRKQARIAGVSPTSDEYRRIV